MIVFVIMPFGKKFDEVYEDIIKQPLLDEGCEVIRADEVSQQRNVLKDIIYLLAKADLVIADLTGLNSNVMYELGLAHAFLKPTLVITQNISELPFDVRSYRAHEYSLEYRNVKLLHKEIGKTIQAYRDGDLVAENPVTDFLPHYTVLFFENEVEKTGFTSQVVSGSALKNQEPGVLLEQAWNVYFHEKNYETAISIAETVLNVWPDNGDAHQIVGNSAVRLGKLEKAIKHGEILVKSEPLNWEGYSILADAYLQMGRWSDALPMLEKELKLTYQNLKYYVHYQIGRAYEKLGNLDAAIDAYQSSAALSEDSTSRVTALDHVQRLRNIRDST